MQAAADADVTALRRELGTTEDRRLIYDAGVALTARLFDEALRGATTVYGLPEETGSSRK